MCTEQEPEWPDDAAGARDAAAGQDERAARLQGAAEMAQTTVADEVDEDVVAAAVAGEVVDGVVDALVGAELFSLLQVAGAADGGDVQPVGLGELDGEGADSARGSVDKDALPGLGVGGSQAN